MMLKYLMIVPMLVLSLSSPSFAMTDSLSLKTVTFAVT